MKKIVKLLPVIEKISMEKPQENTPRQFLAAE